jgi:fibronectin-binding autotransporter adhesin
VRPGTLGGAITVNAGTLAVEDTLTGTNLTVRSGATLSGNGSITCPVVIQAGGTIAPGGDDPGTLTLQNSVTLAGTARFRMAKTGISLVYDQLGGIGNLTCGGTLIVTNTGAWPLEAGDTLTLFSAAAYTGAFANLILPPLPPPLAWDTAHLVRNVRWPSSMPRTRP